MQLTAARHWLQRNSNTVFFVGGFLFDAVTIVRIDSITDLLLQTLYLLAVSFLIIRRFREEMGNWAPSGWIARVWKYETEALHFFYGGLLSAYVILYFKSSTGSRSLIFLALIVLLMFANEMPQVKRAGHLMRLGLYAFCVVSFLNYLFPVLIGRMGSWVFALAWLASAGVMIWFLRHLARRTTDPRRWLWRNAWSPAVVLVLVGSLYALRLIPPVPLSLQYAGIYHKIDRLDGQYQLYYPKPPWYRFWQKDSGRFLARPGDAIYCFVRVFAPRRFSHQISLRWQTQVPGSGLWITSDRIPLSVQGGRGAGYRGFAAKSRFDPGQWRVEIVTEDERILGSVHFRVLQDSSTDERPMRHRIM